MGSITTGKSETASPSGGVLTLKRSWCVMCASSTGLASNVIVPSWALSIHLCLRTSPNLKSARSSSLYKCPNVVRHFSIAVPTWGCSRVFARHRGSGCSQKYEASRHPTFRTLRQCCAVAFFSSPSLLYATETRIYLGMAHNYQQSHTSSLGMSYFASGSVTYLLYPPFTR
jgi:hypothetical protein